MPSNHRTPSNHRSLSKREAILRDHAEIEREVAAISGIRAEELRDAPGRIGDLEERLRRLLERLRRHFDEEESGGFFEQVLESTPNVQRAVGTLRDEHEEFLHRLERLVGTLGESGGQGDLDRIAAELHRFAAAYRRHEETEDSLLLDSQNDDVAAAD